MTIKGWNVLEDRKVLKPVKPSLSYKTWNPMCCNKTITCYKISLLWNEKILVHLHPNIAAVKKQYTLSNILIKLKIFLLPRKFKKMIFQPK